MGFLTAACTGAGMKMDENQDAILWETAYTSYGQVFFGAVCDGMGGLKKGETASGSLIRGFSSWFHREFPPILYSGMKEKDLRKSWERLLFEQDRRICRYGENHEMQLGTTALTLLLLGHSYYIVHVGDCRIYLIKDEVRQLTKDQTFVQREVDAGRMSPGEAGQHPKRHILLQCIGAGNQPEPVFYQGEFSADSIFVMCSDGFWHEIREEEFRTKLCPEKIRTEKAMEEAAKELICLSKLRGETDNLSVVLVRT